MLTVTVVDTSARAYKTRATRIARWLLRAHKKESSALEIFLVGDAQINKNVLAFPAAKNFPRPDLPQTPLGEIYLNPTYIKKHGEDFTYMLVHGFLHLLGYDHIKKNDRIKMEAQEKRLLRQYTQKS